MVRFRPATLPWSDAETTHHRSWSRLLFGVNSLEGVNRILNDRPRPRGQCSFAPWPYCNDGCLTRTGTQVLGYELFAFAGHRDLIGPGHQKAVAEAPSHQCSNEVDLRDHGTDGRLKAALGEHELGVVGARQAAHSSRPGTAIAFPAAISR
jgi:hypothetical protein